MYRHHSITSGNEAPLLSHVWREEGRTWFPEASCRKRVSWQDLHGIGAREWEHLPPATPASVSYWCPTLVKPKGKPEDQEAGQGSPHRWASWGPKQGAAGQEVNLERQREDTQWVAVHLRACLPFPAPLHRANASLHAFLSVYFLGGKTLRSDISAVETRGPSLESGSFHSSWATTWGRLEGARSHGFPPKGKNRPLEKG